MKFRLLGGTLLAGVVMIIIWDAMSPRAMRGEPDASNAHAPLAQVLSVCYLGGGETLLAAGAEPLVDPSNYPGFRNRGWVGVFDASSGVLVRQLPPFTQQVRGVAVNPRTREVVTFGVYEKETPGAPITHGEVRVWDPDAKSEGRKFPGHSRAVLSAAFDPLGEQLVTASSGPATIRRQAVSPTEGVSTWDYAGGTLVHTTEGHSDLKPQPRGGRPPADPGPRAVLSVAWSPDGKRLFSAGEDGAVKVWDAATLSLLATVCRRDAWAEQVAVTPNGKQLLALFGDGVIVVWDAQTFKEVRTAAIAANPLKATPDRITALGFDFKGAGLAVSPDGKTAAIATGQAVATVPLDGAGDPTKLTTVLTGPTCVAYSPDGRYLAIGFSDAVLGKDAKRVGGVEQWDLQEKGPRKMRVLKP